LKAWIRAARSVGTCLALSFLTAAPALAQYDDDPLPTWYVGPFAGYTFADPDRVSKDGLNFHLIAGRSLYPGIALELNAFATPLDSEVAGGPDTDLMGGGVDLALGETAAGTPIFLLGLGAVQQDIGGQSKTNTFGNLGMGVYLPFSFGGELWRLEGRYHVVLGEHPALPGEDVLDDFRINLGALLTFGGEEPPPAESVPPPPAESVPVPPADTDLDDDGIEDAADQCPGTPPGVPVDPSGCEPKAAEPPVEEPKAEPVTPPAPAVMPAPAPAPVAPVEDIATRAVYFGSESSSLTAKGYELLRDVAAAMQADPQMRVEIEGHADTSGSAAQNVPLARERAEVVRDFLVNLGVDASRLVIKAYGAYRPVNDNATIERRATNRRVTFRRLDRTP
jgi:OOP family OmpA-OmpF porin